MAERSRCMVVALLCCLLLLVTSAKALNTSPSAVLATPDRFDGQTVTISGTITNLREHVSQRGNAYYTFDLSDGKQAIRVFVWPGTVGGRRPPRQSTGTSRK